SNNIISFKFKGVDKVLANWEMIAIKEFSATHPHPNENKYFILHTNNRNSCLHNGLFDTEYSLKGKFNDTNVVYYTFNKLDGVSNYNGIATDAYIKFLKGTTTITPSKLYVNYNGKNYYTNQVIYIPEAKNNKSTSNYSFELKGMTAADASWELNIPDYKGSFISTIKSTGNPVSYSNKIGEGRYSLNAYSGEDAFSTFVMGCDLWISYLSHIPNPGSTSKGDLASLNNEYTVAIAAGENVNFWYETNMTSVYPSEPVSETKVIVYTEVEGVLTPASSSTMGSRGYFSTTGGLGNKTATEIEYKYFVVKLILKQTNEVLVTRRIKVKLTPNENITKIVATDYTNICSYDKQYKGPRTAEDGKKLYMIVSPECASGSNFKMNIGFSVNTSNNNADNIPVNWTYKQQNFTDNTHTTTQFESMTSDKHGMSIKDEFTTQLSSITPTFINSPWNISLGGFKIKLDPALITNLNKRNNVKNLQLMATADVFNQTKTANVVFIHNIKDDVEFEMSGLTATEGADLKKLQEIAKLSKMTQNIANRLKDMYLFKEGTKIEFKVGMLKPSYSCSFKEKENSRLYEKSHDLSIKYGDASLKVTKSIDLIKKLPLTAEYVIETVEGATEVIGLDFDLTLSIDIGFGIAPSFAYKPSYVETLGDTDDGPLPPVEEKHKFTAELTPEFSLTPKAEIAAAGYKATLTVANTIKLKASIDYDPVNAKFSSKIAIPPIVSDPKFTLKNGSKELWSGGVQFRITKEDIVLYDSKDE
ncbi:MAG TPA: hypothetical protein VL947_05475, partial [Cytophagales bacterium]|nr:hypothetical protein [Cytophagales bacterium]